MSDIIPQPRITEIAYHILSHIESRLRDNPTKQLSDEDLLTLHSVFGAVLQKALDILEKHTTLVAYSTPKKSRVLIEIKGENDRCYRVFPRINYCPCLAFKHQVIQKLSQVCCKHVLAARLANILGKIVEHEVTQEQYLMLLRSMFDL